jgi:aerobic carbon-monoxide dehydrogenase medium subunit
VIPAPFDYLRPTTVADALRLLAENADEAKVIAGGHSLLPMMKLRLAQPAVLVDIAGIDELKGIMASGDRIVIGAASTHAAVARSALLAEQVPLLAHAASQVGDPQVRHRGTIGGSLAHSDPAADLPVAAVAADATLVIAGPGGRREVRVDDFFRGPFETAVEPDELLVAVSVPAAPGTVWGYEKFSQRANDWAMVSVAVSGPRVVLGGVAGVPWRATAVEEALRSGTPVDRAAALAADGLSPAGDIRADGRYREHLAVVLTGRALRAAGYR